MKVTVGGLVIDELGNVLLVRRGRSWAPPGGPLTSGQLPDAAVVDVVESITGLKTLPVRLVGLYFERRGQKEALHFQFRCLVRGGTLAPGADVDAVHHFPPDDLPAPLSGQQAERLADGLSHTGGPPAWRDEQRPQWRRFLDGLQRSAQETGEHQVDVIALLPDTLGGIQWVELDGRYRLPITRPAPGEPPWLAAARATRQQTRLDRPPADLAAVFAGGDAGLTLVFRAAATAPADVPRFLPGSEPESADRQHVALVAGALQPGPTTFTHIPQSDA